MVEDLQSRCLDEAFERIEETILPSLSMMLDTLLEAAALARPGIDAGVYGAELRTIGCQIEALRRQVEEAHAAQEAEAQDVRAA
jgi:hypothetical protein